MSNDGKRKLYFLSEAKKKSKGDKKITIPENSSLEMIELIGKLNNHIEARGGKPYCWTYDDFDIGFPLGKGKFGRVYLAKERSNNILVALKLMHKSEIKRCNVEVQVRRELEIHSRLNHPNILKIYTHFHDSRFLYIALEYASGGELYSYMKSLPNRRFDEKLSAKFTAQLVAALEYCHSKNVIHRDIKPENILLDRPGGDVKLSDFGWSVHAPSLRRRTMCGTLDYLPPEMVMHHGYDHRVDHWCIGVLLYEFLVGVPPFESETQEQTYSKITNVEFVMPKHVSAAAADLIYKLLKKNPSERINFPDIPLHPFIKENYQ